MNLTRKFREVFVYLCPFCTAPYSTIVENGKSKFVHKGVSSTKDKVALPTPNCVPFHDYVVFEPCKHCCPDVFVKCQACKLGHPGKIDEVSRPTQIECFCHYCVEKEDDDLNQIWSKVDTKIDNTLTQAGRQLSAQTPKVFISYAHKDEPFKDELVTMLAGLQRRGIINAWHDRRIEAGSEWFSEITKTIDESKIALLLVSPDFIASGFIQQTELVQLFQRRSNEGLQVIPIILRACLWQSEPVIKDLQALPKDGKAVVTFSPANGDRDQVWADIGKVLERIAIDMIKSGS